MLWTATWLLVLALVRVWLNASTLGDSAGCRSCLALPTLGHDALLLAAGCALLALAAATARVLLRVPLVIVVLLLMLLMTADVAVMATLALRLYVFDVFKFGMEWSALSGFLASLTRSSGAIWVPAAAGAVLACFVMLWPGASSRRLARVFGVAALVFAAGGLVSRLADPAFINADAYLNVVELHFAQGVNEPYSAPFVRELAAREALPAPVCRGAQAQRPNVIVIAVESLSSYQSKLLGGPLDLLPELDAIARGNTWFSDFRANGFTTDAGLIALLTGRAPVPAVGRYRSIHAFAGFEAPEGAIPALVEPAGYGTHFFTTGDLGFLDKSPWLQAIGFDHVEGAEQAFYQGWPRGGFNAAEDRALYLRLQQWMDQRDATTPYFAFALTVQSHPPFVDPVSRRLDEAAVFTAVDRELGVFYRQLQARGFFERGVLIITGDHRSMTPLHAQERSVYHDAAFARVPLVIAGRSGLPAGPIDLPFQQTDLPTSLADLTSTQVCARADQGSFLRQAPLPPAWRLHVRGDARNRVDVAFAQGDGAILLKGDDSRWVGQRPANWRQIEDAVHRDRIHRGVLDSDIQQLIEILGR
jgi:lipoteichoic acid synthase